MKRPIFKGHSYGLPSLISGMIARYDATNIDGSNNSTFTDGEAVSQWNDISGNNEHLVQATGSRQPLFRLTGLRGLQTVQFDGSNDFLSSNSTLSLGNFTAFIVMSTSSTGDRIIYEFGTTYTDAGNFYLLTGTNASINKVGAAHPTNASAKDVYVSWANKFGTAVITHTSGGTHATHLVYVNGVEQKTTNRVSNNPGSTVYAKTLYVGARTGAVAPMAGKISELIIYNSSLTRNQMAAVEGYLAVKWGTAHV